MINLRTMFVAVSGLALAVSQPVRAETLGEAIADAYRNNPRLQAERAQLRALDESVIQAGSPYRLNAAIIGSATYEERLDRRFDLFGNRGPFATDIGKTLGVTLSASQILSNGGRTAAQISAAEADVLAERERLREVENFILLEVVDAYVSVRRDNDLIAIQQQTVSSFERQVDQARARERGGDLTRTDISQAEAQLFIVRTQLAQARANLEQSRARFATVVGRSPTTLDAEPPLPGLPISIDLAYQIAETESPTLWQPILNERGARSRIAVERAQRNPTVELQGRFGYNNQASYATRDLGRAYTGTLNFTLPLLQGGLVGSRIREAIARQQQATFLIDDARRSVDQALLNAWNQAITAQDQITAGESAVTAAQSALLGVRRGFSEGFRSNFEVLDSEQRLLNAQLIVASARYARYAAQANLLAYLGRLQAATIVETIAAYDAAANLERQKHKQIAPFGPIVGTLDRLQHASSSSRPSPEIPRAIAPVVAPAQVAPPSGTLATSLSPKALN